MQELSRCEILKTQFFVNTDGVPSDNKASLERIFHFIYEYTDLLYLSFMREDVLFQYLGYHAKNRFRIISFCQTIKDIKFFISFLKNRKDINCPLDVDLSLLHFNLWTKL